MEKYINILLVEDDHLDAIELQRTLDKMKIFYRLQVARNGEEGIRLLQESSGFVPDVALVDITMPRMNGLEFIAQVRKNIRWEHLKCFVITTSEETSDKCAANELGISGYIVKPLRLFNSTTPDAFNLMIDLMNLSASFPR